MGGYRTSGTALRFARAAMDLGSRVPYRTAFNSGRFGRKTRATRTKRPRIALGVEEKYHDTTLVASSVTNAADMTGGEDDPLTTLCLSAPAQGDAENERDGKKIVITSIQLKGHIQTAPEDGQDIETASALQSYMVALVLDTQTNGAQLNSEDVFTNPGASASTNTNALVNLQYSSRFKILKIWHLKRDPAGVAIGGSNAQKTYNVYRYRDGQCHGFSFYKRCKIPVTFSNTTGVVGSVVDNSLHVMSFANGLTDTPSISYNARIRFVG